VKRLAAIALVLVGFAWLRAHAGERIRVDYYHIPYCMACSRVLRALDDLSRELGDRVAIRTVDCFSDEGKAAAKKYGFVTHGIVVSAPERGLFFMQKDHGVSGADVAVVVRNELAKEAL
jgi:hypothetical protein